MRKRRHGSPDKRSFTLRSGGHGSPLNWGRETPWDESRGQRLWGELEAYGSRDVRIRVTRLDSLNGQTGIH